MPRRFSCPDCSEEVLTFVRIGELARCRGCGAEVTVPETATETSEEPDWAERGRARAAGWGDGASAYSIECPFCGAEMEPGEVSVHGTFFRFSLIGWLNRQRCWFRAASGSGEEVLVERRTSKPACRCPSCRSVLVPGPRCV
ncbi:MAG: PF20097 family protein [Planctomycetota bacterium]|jgi:ribosomal protein S27E